MSDWITVTVASTKGSVPRDAGTMMRVYADHQSGTIGGGRLEFEAAKLARDMLAEGVQHRQRSVPLGPDLGQCCGGAVVLDFTAGHRAPAPRQAPLWIWGAGHVGRAIVDVMAPFQDRAMTWIDTAQTRFPDDLPPHVAPLVATDPTRAVPHAPDNAHHLILTYSHDIDLALCDGLLRHGFASAGLIGSQTKWARFRKRLAALGHAAASIDAIACPIGDPSLGKHPQAIAVGVAAQLISAVAPATAQGDEPA